MTVAAKFTHPLKGHGLTQKILAPLHAALANEQPVEDIVCLVVLHPTEYKGEKGKKHVKFEPVRVEVAQDQDGARQEITLAYTERTTVATIPLAFPGWKDPEQQKFLVGAVAEWASEEGLNTADVNERWIGLFGEQANTTDYRKGSPERLKEFCLHVGAIADTEPDDDSSDES